MKRIFKLFIPLYLYDRYFSLVSQNNYVFNQKTNYFKENPPKTSKNQLLLDIAQYLLERPYLAGSLENYLADEKLILSIDSLD